MTPKEKAEELVDKYRYADYTDIGEEGCKQCALITVQECIDTTRGRYGDVLSMQYWLDVEKEISLL